MRKLARVLALFLCLHAMESRATIDATDVAPAATLLLPYFEVDLADPTDGINTLFTVRNTADLSIVAHVMIFTDLSVGTVAFDVPLSRFATRRFDLREIFAGTATTVDEVGGEKPVVNAKDTPVDNPPPPPSSGTFGSGFEDGTLGQWDAHESDATVETMRAHHTGQPSERTGLCGGVDHEDSIARGYVVVDVVTGFAGPVFPNDGSYLGNGVAGTLAPLNAITGSFRIVEPLNNSELGSPMLHFEWADTDNFGPTFDGTTFHGRYDDYMAHDRREPLGKQWVTTFESSEGKPASVLYWQDPLVVVEPFETCGTPPAPFPISQQQVIGFDTDSNAFNQANVDPTLTTFPWACGRVTVGTSGDIIPFDAGWLFVHFLRPMQTRGQAVILVENAEPGTISAGQIGVSWDNLEVGGK